MAKVFIDGEHGTTGLQIRSRLKDKGLEPISLPYDSRHDLGARLEAMRQSDIVILCLPDDAARDTVAKLKELSTYTRVIDSSTAHRVSEDWVYGFGEMAQEQKTKIANAQYVANPGCYATGVISLLRPLRDSEILPADYPLTIFAVSGYSGGGKKMMHAMEDPQSVDAIHSQFFSYALDLGHKHLPEIVRYSLLKNTPAFIPNVGRFKQGTMVHIPLHRAALKNDIDAIRQTFIDHYRNQTFVSVAGAEETTLKSRLDPEELAGSDNLKIYLFASQDGNLINLCAVFDNLGKGAAGAAVQNLDLMISGRP